MGRKLTQEEFGQKVEAKYNGKYSVVGKYTKSTEKITLRCNRCGLEFTRVAAEVIESKGNTCCPICDKNFITRSGLVEGINDLWATNPEVASILKNPNDGYKYTSGSNLKAVFVCPQCGNERLKTIAEVVRYGFHCNLCGDGCSYPNKYMANLLSMNGINYDTEYSFPEYKYRYDFHFVINNTNYLVEMDGALSHGCVDFYRLSIAEQNQNDLEKDLLAEKFGYKLIRIDCKYPDVQQRFSYIKHNIIISDLKYVLNDLSEDTLNKCDDIAANTSFIVEMANAWNSGIHSKGVLAELFKVCKPTVKNRLDIAVKIGLINETYDEVSDKLKTEGIKSRQYMQGSPVICNETGVAFCSIADAKRAGFTTVDRYLNNKISYSGVLPDGTKLTWKRITHKEYEKLKSAS